jgi:hypothetical protein
MRTGIQAVLDLQPWRKLMFLARVMIALLVVSVPAHAGKKGKKKKGAEVEPIFGWHQEEGWTGSCYFPADFGAMGAGDKRMEWQKTRDSLMNQWQGGRGDGVSFDSKAVTNVETALLSKADRIEEVAAKNLELCTDAMASGSTIAWGNWFTALYGQLTAGECPWPSFANTQYNYLDINNDWQNPANLCKGDKVKVKASKIDYFRLESGGDWINASGTGAPAETGYPCTEPGCEVGALIVKFKGESGIEFILPVGLEGFVTAPEHGSITIMINDNNLSDNVWKVERGLEHHTAIDYARAE